MKLGVGVGKEYQCSIKTNKLQDWAFPSKQITTVNNIRELAAYMALNSAWGILWNTIIKVKTGKRNKEIKKLCKMRQAYFKKT